MRAILFCLVLAVQASAAAASGPGFDYRRVESIIVIDGSDYFMFSKFPDFLEMRALIAEAVSAQPERVRRGGESLELLLIGNGQQRILRLGDDWLSGSLSSVRLTEATAKRLHELLAERRRQGAGGSLNQLAAALNELRLN